MYTDASTFGFASILTPHVVAMLPDTDQLQAHVVSCTFKQLEYLLPAKHLHPVCFYKNVQSKTGIQSE